MLHCLLNKNKRTFRTILGYVFAFPFQMLRVMTVNVLRTFRQCYVLVRKSVSVPSNGILFLRRRNLKHFHSPQIKL